MKVVINDNIGSFGVSPALADRLGWDYDKDYYEESGFLHYEGMYDLDRSDPALVAAVEELGELANSRFSELAVVEIPDGSFYKVIPCERGDEYILWSESPINIAWGPTVIVD